jgi:MoaA/NifB/PqqE/SkfB family radical SAM enzyme
MIARPTEAPDYGPQRLTVELTNICNLHCGYCLRDEDALYHTPANFFPTDLLSRVLREARAETGISQVMFTGGEPTLHPRFAEILSAVREEGLKCSFITNGWHFERIWTAVRENREAITHVAFSLDGPTHETHDRWRGDGSFVRLVRAFSRCNAAGLPFSVKVGIRSDTLPALEQVALFAARMGATALSFDHLLPTSQAFEQGLALTAEERTQAEQEVATLARLFKMRITLEVGYYNLDESAPCSVLAGASCNVNYRGQLSLCCNLAGFRGSASETDVVADLHNESFAAGHARLRHLAEEQLERRRAALRDFAERGETPDLNIGSPCLFCLSSFGKVPWHAESEASNSRRSLPVVQAT